MKTIIWDFNGTILDDAAISVRIENAMLQERGYPHGYTVEQYRALYRFPMEEYYRQIGYTFETESFADAAAQFMRMYEELFAECTLCEGVTEKLREAVDRGYRNVILSSCEDRILHEQCDALGITPYFERIMGVDNLLGGSKVELGREWMKSQRIAPANCLYFGDTTADYDTAKALDIANLTLIANGHQSYERLSALHPQVVRSLTEIKLPEQ